ALSTYSVSPSANHQFLQLYQTGAERMFPSSDEIGTYNALHVLMTAEVSAPSDCQSGTTEKARRDLLWSISKDKEHPKTEKPLYLTQYGWREGNKPDDYNAPPVRLTALGHDGYWPIPNLGPFDKEPTSTLLPLIVNKPHDGSPSAPVKQFDDGPAPVQVPNSW